MPKTEHSIVLHTIDSINEALSTIEVTRILLEFVGGYGFETVIVAQLVNPAIVGSDRLVISNWPDEYVARRIEEMTIIKDPVVRHALRTKQPFTWQAAYEHADRTGQRVLNQGRDFTQNEGMMFPVYSYDEVPGGVSLGTKKLELSPAQIKLVDLVCQHAYMRIASFEGPFPHEIRASLSNREVEVLHYVAAGKSNWEIGRILGLSEYTVHAYMKSASKKLNTSGRAHTVAMAMAQQIILT